MGSRTNQLPHAPVPVAAAWRENVVALLIFWLLAAACGSAVEEAAPEPAPAPAGPATVESSDGIDLAYSSQGEGDPALVLIHGWACNRSFWEHQMPALSGRYRVVSVDLAGHGESGTGRAEWSLAAFGDDVRAVVEALNLERVILIGHSMGGQVALEAARLIPDRVAGVIGVDTLHDAEFDWSTSGWDQVLEDYEKDFAGTCDQFVGSMFLEGADPGLVDSVKRQMCSARPGMAIALLRSFSAYDVSGALSQVKVPVRCINAGNFPTRIEVNSKYADFDAVIMDGVGHFLMMEKPREFNRLLHESIQEISG